MSKKNSTRLVDAAEKIADGLVKGMKAGGDLATKGITEGAKIVADTTAKQFKFQVVMDGVKFGVAAIVTHSVTKFILVTYGMTKVVTVGAVLVGLAACIYYATKIIQAIVNPAWYIMKYTVKDATDIYKGYKDELK